MKCLLCYQEFQQICASHLKKHGETTQSYREKFPDAPLVKPVEWTEERREAARQRRLGTTQNQLTKDKIGAKSKGRVKSLETIEKQRVSYLAAIEANGGGFATGPRSDEFKAKMSEIARNRSPEFVQTKVEQMWAARRGQKENDQVLETKRNARVKFMAENPNKVGWKFFDTVPEREFEQELIKLGVPYQKQFHTAKPHFLYDFKVLEDILIEIDGPYHYNPKMYKTKAEFIAAKGKDETKNLNALNQGFRIGRIRVGKHLPSNWLEVLEEQGILIQKDPE